MSCVGVERKWNLRESEKLGGMFPNPLIKRGKEYKNVEAVGHIYILYTNAECQPGLNEGGRGCI